ncbi:periplasmic binding family protein [Roseiarcus fermentans]|uniref:Periplasmic binding family protein n=1 Tax=Roseiarcus fermentans TaxID=1473586 RepID=A0A366FU40_9HYPH|nr:substrate-binding domain-containing protein [Roseiarcus fermentans]RBP17255.1 periplasmic binding family protein [Roseiarcus fermentans]
MTGAVGGWAAGTLACLLTLAAVSPARPAEDRDYVWLVAPASLNRYAVSVVEAVGARSRQKFAKIETADSDGAVSLLCASAGLESPDAALLTRDLSAEERSRCIANGVQDLVPLVVAYDAFVLVRSRDDAPARISRVDLFRAVAAEIPDPAARQDASVPAILVPIVANPLTRWRDVAPSLPDAPIHVLVPPAGSALRQLVSGLLQRPSCFAIPPIAALARTDDIAFNRICRSLRGDPIVQATPASLDDTIARLGSTPGSIAVMRFGDLQQHADRLQPVAIDGVTPSAETILSDSYRFSRPMRLVVKSANFSLVSGFREFAGEFMSGRAAGEGGYLIQNGAVPLSRARRASVAEQVLDLSRAPPPPASATQQAADQAGAAVRETIARTLFQEAQRKHDRSLFDAYVTIFPDGASAKDAATERDALDRSAAERGSTARSNAETGGREVGEDQSKAATEQTLGSRPEIGEDAAAAVMLALFPDGPHAQSARLLRNEVAERRRTSLCPDAPNPAPAGWRDCWRPPPLAFAAGSSDLTVDGEATLQAVAEVLAADPSVQVELTCRPDAGGGQIDTLLASLKRVQTAEHGLEAKHVDPSRIAPIAILAAAHPDAASAVDPSGAAGGRVEMTLYRSAASRASPPDRTP